MPLGEVECRCKSVLGNMTVSTPCNSKQIMIRSIKLVADEIVEIEGSERKGGGCDLCYGD